jgi:type II secretory pathway pseudopilin PulG
MNFIKQARKMLQRNEGYTLDQTILIVAIIAILVTLIIITVGWNILNRASGTKLAAQFRQVEDANNQFYAEWRQWPLDIYSTAPTSAKDGNVVALSGLTPAGATLNSTITGAGGLSHNYLSGFTASTSNVVHTFSSAATNYIEQLRVTAPTGFPGNSKYIIVQFNNVPFSQVQQAEYAIDGQANENYTSGRVIAYKDTSGDCMVASLAAGNAATTTTNGGTLVNACYVANNTQ